MEYDIEAGESVSTAVIRGVSALRGCNPCSVRPLAAVLDPDALDALFAASDESGTAERRLRFTYHGYDVIVGGDGAITVSEAGNDVASTNPET